MTKVTRITYVLVYPTAKQVAIVCVEVSLAAEDPSDDACVYVLILICAYQLTFGVVDERSEPSDEHNQTTFDQETVHELRLLSLRMCNYMGALVTQSPTFGFIVHELDQFARMHVLQTGEQDYVE